MTYLPKHKSIHIHSFIYYTSLMLLNFYSLVTTNERIDAEVNKSVSSLKNWIQQTQPNIHCYEIPWVVKSVKERFKHTANLLTVVQTCRRQ